MTERRQFPRKAVRLKVICSFPGRWVKKIAAMTRDISLGGIGLKLASPIEAGKEIDITIHKPFWGGPIEAKGRVAWSGGDKPGNAAAGIEFTNIPWTRIAAFVSSLS